MSEINSKMAHNNSVTGNQFTFLNCNVPNASDIETDGLHWWSPNQVLN